MEIVLASSNQHKVQEINDIVKSLNLAKSIKFILPPDGFDPIEDGKSFEENSYIKAHAAWEMTKGWTLADDSGLCIDALGGGPGIYSARYAETPAKRIERVLNEMKDVKNRAAHFECCMTLINPNGELAFSYTGKCIGSITETVRGKNGFGYDPIFLIEGSSKTMAELTKNEKKPNFASFKSFVCDFKISDFDIVIIGARVYFEFKE